MVRGVLRCELFVYVHAHGLGSSYSEARNEVECGKSYTARWIYLSFSLMLIAELKISRSNF